MCWTLAFCGYYKKLKSKCHSSVMMKDNRDATNHWVQHGEKEQPSVGYFQMQSLLLPMFLSSLCCALAFKTRLSNVGGAIAMSNSTWLNVIFLGLSIRYSNAFVADTSSTTTSFTLVLEVRNSRLQNLYWENNSYQNWKELKSFYNFEDKVGLDGVSERYRASAADESDEDYGYSDSEEEVLEEEEASLTSVLESGFLEFGSFHSNTVPIKPLKPIKPEIEGSTIKIGEITCFLVQDPVLSQEIPNCIDGLLSAPPEATEEVLFEIPGVIPNLLDKDLQRVAIGSSMVQSFSINSFCDFGSESFCFALNVTPINHGSVTIDRPTPAPPWFSTSEQRRGFDVLDEALKRQVVTAVFAVGSCVWLSDLTGVHTVVFDPGGTLEAASGGCKIEIDLDAICITTFDPGGTLNAVSISATPPHHSVFVVDPGGAASAISSPPLQRSVFVFDPGGYHRRSLLIAAIIPLALIAAVIPFALSFVRVQLGKGFDEWHY